MPAKKGGYGCYAFICGIFLVILGFGLGFIIGYFVLNRPTLTGEDEDSKKMSAAENITFLTDVFNRSFHEDLDADFRQFKKYYQKGAYNLIANYTHEKFVEYELDSVDDVPLVLSVPTENPDTPNTLKLIDYQGNVVFETNLSDVGPTFSLSANVKGAPVFVNYAERADFLTLMENKVNLKNKIFVARVGRIHLRNMIQNSEEYAPQALLIYEDRTATQLNPYMLVPLVGSVPSAKDFNRHIPVQFLTYETAQTIFRLDPRGPGIQSVMEKWNYPVSVGAASSNKSYKLVLNMANKVQNHVITNVFGKIDGAIESDRYVILGNYHNFGLNEELDIGTKLLLQLAHTLSGLKKEGWRSRRTILFANFDARNYGLTSSADWLNATSQKISSQAVIYINLGECKKLSKTMTSSISAVSAIYSSINRTSYVNELLNGAHSESSNEDDKTASSRTQVENEEFLHRNQMPGGFTDTSPFVYYAGIPAVDFSSSDASCQINTGANLTTYYRNVLAVALDFADSDILPLNLQLLAMEMVEAYESWFSYDSHYKIALHNYGIDISTLRKSISKFQDTVYKFYKALVSRKGLKPVTKRIISDKLLQVEKVLILPYVVEDPYFRNSIFVPDHYNYLEVTGFRGIINAIEQFDDDKLLESVNKLKTLLSDITHAINQATGILRTFRFQ